ncbi:hypothetical protein [Vibrio crassostreae]|uniref:hypothetical protein n=1 Tax=Vibrio crassostreae TaxID=246167 RepID=UPI001B30956E|nr:hypothetical protein [Vibrio crassostreae]
MQIYQTSPNQPLGDEELKGATKTNFEKLEAEVVRRGVVSDVELNNIYRTPFASDLTRLEKQISTEVSSIRKAFTERIEKNSAKISQLKQKLGGNTNIPLGTYSDISELERVLETLEANRQAELSRLLKQHQTQKAELLANYEQALSGLLGT